MCGVHSCNITALNQRDAGSRLYNSVILGLCSQAKRATVDCLSNMHSRQFALIVLLAVTEQYFGTEN